MFEIFAYFGKIANISKTIIPRFVFIVIFEFSGSRRIDRGVTRWVYLHIDVFFKMAAIKIRFLSFFFYEVKEGIFPILTTAETFKSVDKHQRYCVFCENRGIVTFFVFFNWRPYFYIFFFISFMR